jgi:hypothetical protein
METYHWYNSNPDKTREEEILKAYCDRQSFREMMQELADKAEITNHILCIHSIQQSSAGNIMIYHTFINKE